MVEWFSDRPKKIDYFFGTVLKQAENTGKVIIGRKAGRTFALIPEKKLAPSPLDVPSINAKVTTKKIFDIIRKGRKR
jgi:antitoxin Phd